VIDSEADRTAIFSGNAERILGIAPAGADATNQAQHG
jgi:hypothetical protein